MATTFLQAGTMAPDITVQDQDGSDVSLQDFQGKQPVVLFIYPKDGTPTCTVEACNLRDNYSALQDAGYAVIGISPDSVRKHQNFIAKQSLPFPLWADTEHQLIEAFGAWGEKKMYGKTYMGVMRSTFIINKEGEISHVIEKVKAKEHTQQILDAVSGS